MLQKPIHKDVLQEYEVKPIFGMSYRKLISAGLGIFFALAAYLILLICWGAPTVICMFFAAVALAPAVAFGWMQPYQMMPERFIPMFIDDKSTPQHVGYIATCSKQAKQQNSEVLTGEKPSKEQIAAERQLPEWAGYPRDEQSKRTMRSARQKWQAVARAQAEIAQQSHS